MGYHVREIDKGQIGEFSKIKEEFEELEDAVSQHNPILALVELSDMIGAIELYLERRFGGTITLDHLRQMSDLTRSAFEEGDRK